MALQVGELYGTLSLETQQFDQGVQGIQGKFAQLGGFVATTFAGMAAGAVATLGGALIGGVMAVDDYKKSMNGLQAQTGATTDEMASMSEAMKGIYSRNYGESFQDIADVMAYAKQSTGALGEELEYLTQDALMLRDTFQMDVTESLRGADAMMEQFGATGTEAMAYLAEATQKGLNKNEDLVDTIEEYSVYFKTAGLGIEDMFGILENASKSGVRNLDFVGDAFKEMTIRTKDGSKTTVEAYQALGLNADKMMADFAAGGEKGKAAYKTMMDALIAIKDPVEKNTIGVALFGTKFEDLEAKAIESMANLNGTITGSVDTLNEINEIKYDSFGAAMQGIGRQLMVGLIMPLGEKVLPILEKFSTWLQAKIPAIIGFFKNMGEGSSGAFEKIKSVITNVLDFIGPYIMDIFGSVVSWWKTNGQEMLTNMKIVWDGIVAVFNFALPFIKMLVVSVIGNLKGVIMGGLNFISGLFKVFAGLFTGDWSKMWDGVKQMVGGALQFLWNVFSLMMIGKLLGGIKAFIMSGWGMFKSFGTAIKGTFKDAIDNIVTLFHYFRATGSSIWRAIIDTIKNIIRSFVSAAKQNFSGLLEGVKTTFGNIKTAITHPIQTAKNMVKGFIDEIKGFFRGLKLQLPKIKMPRFSIKNWSKNPVDWVKAMPTLSVDWFKTGGIATGPAIAGVGEAGSEAIVPLAGRRMKPFSDAVGQQVANMLGGLQPAAAGGQTVVLLEIDGKRFAKAVAKPVNNEIQSMKQNESRQRGDIDGL